MTSVSKNAFYNCHALQSVMLPEGVTTIESGAFYGCDNLSSFVLPQAVTRIEDSAFSGCKSLVSVDLPEGLDYLGASAFANCKSLNYLDTNCFVVNCEEGAFRGTPLFQNFVGKVICGKYRFPYHQDMMAKMFLLDSIYLQRVLF